jgi:hypothetical protein
MADPGIVEKNIQFAKGCFRNANHFFAISRFGDISPDICGLTANFLNQGYCFLSCDIIDIDHDNVGAFLGKEQSGFAANPAASARDQRDFIL